MVEEGAVRAAEGAGEAFNVGDMVLHHVLNSQVIELPWVGEVHLPVLTLGAYRLPITRHVVMLWIASLIILLIALAATRTRALKPRGIHNVVEAIVMFVRDEIARKNIGEHGDRFVPYLLTTFVFILTSNLLGLVPYMSTATGNIGVTAALAILAFLTIQVGGMRENGVGGYFKSLVPHGIPWWLVPIMVVVEVLGLFTKPFALCVRLFANMVAGHFVILSLIGLVFMLKQAWVGAVLSVPFAIFVSGIELLVAFLQAYIFTMLTSLFIGMSVHPQH